MAGNGGAVARSSCALVPVALLVGPSLHLFAFLLALYMSLGALTDRREFAVESSQEQTNLHIGIYLTSVWMTSRGSTSSRVHYFDRDCIVGVNHHGLVNPTCVLGV